MYRLTFLEVCVEKTLGKSNPKHTHTGFYDLHIEMYSFEINFILYFKYDSIFSNQGMKYNWNFIF